MRIIVMAMILLAAGQAMAEDIVDLRDRPPRPAVVSGAGAVIINGAIDLLPTPVYAIVPSYDGKAPFVMRTKFRFEDASGRRNLLGRLEVSLYGEEGFYGSERWSLLWSASGEYGDWFRNPRLRHRVARPMDSRLVEQERPIVRYRVEIKASSHGRKSRHKLVNSLVTVVREPDRGGAELAASLLVSSECLLAYRHFKNVLDLLSAPRPDRRAMRAELDKLRFAMIRLDRISMALPGDGPFRHRLAWGDSLEEQAGEVCRLPRMTRADVVAPYYVVLDKLASEALRDSVQGLDHGLGIAAARRAVEALLAYGYEKRFSLQNLRYELFQAERGLLCAPLNYVAEIDAARRRFVRTSAVRTWSPAPDRPAERYLKSVLERTERFFDVARHAALFQVTALRALRGVVPANELYRSHSVRTG